MRPIAQNMGHAELQPACAGGRQSARATSATRAVMSPTAIRRWSSAPSSSSEGRILLCRRAIEPRRGFWTLPAGYLEHGETLAEGAAREAAEEAGRRHPFDGVLALYSISRIGQVQVMFRARFAGRGRVRARDGKPRSPPVRLGRDPVGRAGVSVRALGACTPGARRATPRSAHRRPTRPATSAARNRLVSEVAL